MHAPLNSETHHMMSGKQFKAMKKSAIFINNGRGPTVDEAALIEALRHKDIAGAALDVFEQEPLPADHPLWTTPNVLITPHTAGYGPYLDDRRGEILLDNCRRFLAGQPLRNVVDKAHWF
jgi:phosphoglycerate dehydrogenase-like enzyme